MADHWQFVQLFAIVMGLPGLSMLLQLLKKNQVRVDHYVVAITCSKVILKT
jgi:hypothetical protein